MDATLNTGQVIGGKYELVRPLGRGSMGAVWAAHHRTLSELVAVKILACAPDATDAEENTKAAERFLFEAQVAARLSRRSRHIVRVTDHGEDDGLAYIVMELLEGKTLEAHLHERGPIVAPEAARLVAQAARALSDAHSAHVIHRDLKPANIFLTHDEDGGLLLKLLDFGIARATRTHRVGMNFATGEGLVFGTPGYMSPEQALAGSKLDHRCDLWALATIAYEMLTGLLPVEGDTVAEVLGNVCAGHIVPVHRRSPAVPVGMSQFFARAFAKDIDDRFASATEMAHAFECAAGHPSTPAVAHDVGLGGQPTLRGQSLTSPLPTRWRHAWGLRSFHPSSILQGAMASVLALALTGGAIAWAASSRPHPGASLRATTLAGVAAASTQRVPPEPVALPPPAEGRSILTATEPAPAVIPPSPDPPRPTSQPTLERIALVAPATAPSRAAAPPHQPAAAAPARAAPPSSRAPPAQSATQCILPNAQAASARGSRAVTPRPIDRDSVF